MKALTIELEHCYGIKRLKAKLDFSKCGACAIYAPNGVMKSSLAQTFKDIATGKESKDRVFPKRKTKRLVLDESGNPLAPDQVLVLPPYDEVFGNSDKTATLLVDAKLRREYEALYAEIDRAKRTFLDAMRTQSKSKRDLESEISTTFTRTPQEFYRALIRVRDEVTSLPEPQFASVPYDLVADEKVASFLETADVKTLLRDYIAKYNALLEQSKYFRKGTFDYFNASTIAKALTKNGFFRAQHTVTLNAENKIEVKSERELEEVISKEKAAILKDAALKKTFDEMEKRITKNEMLRDFQEFIADNQEVLALMGNLDKLKEEVWKSYFKEHEEIYIDLIERFQAAQQRTKEIQAEAARQRTQWEEVVDIFNRRFFVPFKLAVKNKVSVVIGETTVPTLRFTFVDGDDSAEMERSDLLQVLSTGEKKALYILNVIFEVEVRRQARTDTVFVVDDIADSFDYKNKYAIVQYLRDIADESCFKQIVLTHNFDFFRTVNGRFVSYANCLMAQRTSRGLDLAAASGIRNVFVNDWKMRFFDDARRRIAAIAFIRNIVEYTRGETDPDFAKLTSLLHWRDDTRDIRHAELDSIYSRTFGDGGKSWATPDVPVSDTIRDEAQKCLVAPESSNLENKIVLAIAIRLEAEKHMIRTIADRNFLSSIKTNQTAALLAKYRKDPEASAESLRVLDEVTLMTPESIHLNSFMYEPLIDMSDDHLRGLYTKVLALAQ